MVLILERFDGQEHEAQQPSSDKQDTHETALPEPRSADRQRDRAAAHDEHNGVDRAECQIQKSAAFGKPDRINSAVDGIRGEQAAEQHELGGFPLGNISVQGSHTAVRLRPVVRGSCHAGAATTSSTPDRARPTDWDQLPAPTATTPASTPAATRSQRQEWMPQPSTTHSGSGAPRDTSGTAAASPGSPGCIAERTSD